MVSPLTGLEKSALAAALGDCAVVALARFNVEDDPLMVSPFAGLEKSALAAALGAIVWLALCSVREASAPSICLELLKPVKSVDAAVCGTITPWLLAHAYVAELLLIVKALFGLVKSVLVAVPADTSVGIGLNAPLSTPPTTCGRKSSLVEPSLAVAPRMHHWCSSACCVAAPTPLGRVPGVPRLGAFWNRMPCG